MYVLGQVIIFLDTKLYLKNELPSEKGEQSQINFNQIFETLKPDILIPFIQKD